ncbi:hypothetical protein E4U55_004640, partial [Claviceps digitariae]
MQLTSFLVNALLASVVAAGSGISDPKYCLNQQNKRDLEGNGASLDKRYRSRTDCLRCCHQAAMFCDAACRARYGTVGA